MAKLDPERKDPDLIRACKLLNSKSTRICDRDHLCLWCNGAYFIHCKFYSELECWSI